MAWKEVELKKDEWTPVKEGDCLLGVLIGSEDTTYGKQYTIQNEDDTEFVKLPKHKILQLLMEGVNVGTRCKLEYRGEKDIQKGNPLQIYKLSVWEQDE